MKKIALPLLTIGLLLSGCGSSGTTAADQPTKSTNSEKKSVTPAASPTPAPTPEIDIFEVGELAAQGGVQMTIHTVTASPTVRLNESNYRAGSGYETYTEVPAAADGHYVTVTTTVKNAGKSSMDLTCGYPIEIALMDAEARAFDPIDSLYQMENNPECNARLQPGFEANMTYAFLVPDDADVVAAAFRDTETEHSSTPALVRMSGL